MNRIYQGRVASLYILNEDSEVTETFDRSNLSDQSQSPLWKHHEVFQDAINYYILSLTALACGNGKDNRVLEDMLSRVADAWDTFPRAIPNVSTKPKSIRDSVTGWLPGISKNSTFEEAVESVLEENTAPPGANQLALELLFDRCGGESAIQQNGRTFLPHFTVTKGDRVYPFSAEAIADAGGKRRLAGVLHGEPSTEELKEIASEMKLSWLVKVSEGKYFNFEQSQQRLTEAINFIITKCEKSEDVRLTAMLSNFPDAVSQLQGFRSSVSALPDTTQIPRNKKASKDLTFAALCFKYFPCELTASILRLSVASPKDDKSEDDAARFSKLGDDPIKLARGQGRYIFRAFTALPPWNPVHPGEPVWKEFDIAAFKEALTAFNQFNQKTLEREENRESLTGLLAHLLGKPLPNWKPKKTESGESAEIPDILNFELFTLARQIEGELTLDLREQEVGEPRTIHFGQAEFTYRSGEWKISRAALRGFADISEKWVSLYNRRDQKPDVQDLEKIVKEYQREEKNKKSIGSIPLLLRLCQPVYWNLWIPEPGEESNRILFQMAEFHDLVREYHRSLELINLTPAEPRFSRRPFRFSDLKDAIGKPEYYSGSDGRTFVDVGIAIELSPGQWSPERVRLDYTAPRLHRDQLLGGEESRWLQPMSEAMGFFPDTEDKFQTAVGLMPDFSASGELRMLLNFARTIDAGPLHEFVGKSGIWKGQFNGVKGKSIHLHWPKTANAATKKNPWWKNSIVLKEGFTVLSTDLGQRTAGAWSLLQITSRRPDTNRPVRTIGHDGAREWYAEVVTKGMFRLPGEDQKIWNPNSNRPETEYYGKKGRNSLLDEWTQAKEIAESLLAEEPLNWIGKDAGEKSFPNQNDALLSLANRRLTRLNTFHRWSCFDPDRDEIASRKEKVIDALLTELGHWEDEVVQNWKTAAKNGDWVDFRRLAGSAFENYRESLCATLELIANRVAPLRDRTWKWKRNGNYGELCDDGPPPEVKPKIRGQRGMSLDRIEQLEGLRKLFLRYNRSFDREPGEPAKFGFKDRGRDSGEPCRSLLGKIDRLKEQRINQTAHLILAQALGVRLRQHQIDKQIRRNRDIHGEYEKIPGRLPVDMIVIENLDRYLTSQGRAPSENSRLMKWAHRSVRDKIKMLAEEPFGIPVVEAAASYTSRFCAITAAPGMRCFETSQLPVWLEEQYNKRRTLKSKPGQPEPKTYSTLIEQFRILERHNADRKKNGKKPVTLLLPKPGGPLFLALNAETPVQADINAAVNIGLRAVCSPERLDILHKIRTAKKSGNIKPARINQREKAAYSASTAIQLVENPSKKLTNASKPNFFFNSGEIVELDQGALSLGGEDIPISSGIGTWSTVNQMIPAQIVDINFQRLKEAVGQDSINSLIKKSKIESDYENETLPM